jgi:hypothetical protein
VVIEGLDGCEVHDDAFDTECAACHAAARRPLGGERTRVEREQH